MSIAFLPPKSEIAWYLSPWKPFFILAVFIAWGWLVSTHLEKDAQSARLDPLKWNSFYVCSAGLAIVVMLFAFNFYIAFPLGVVILLVPILLYWKIRNEAVADEFKFHLGFDSIKSSMEFAS